MAVDVIVAKPIEFRVRQIQCVVTAVAFAAIAVAPYPGVGYAEAWWFRLMLVPAVAVLLFAGRGLFRPVTLPVLEIGRDAIRYRCAHEEHTIARAAVVKARMSSYLRFTPALDERLPEFILRPFDKKAVRASLERHGWT